METNEQQCGDEDPIVIEPVYLEKRGLRKLIDLKKIGKYSFYGSFCAVIFIYYLKVMSNPILAFLYTIGTAIVVSYSIAGPGAESWL